MLRFLALWALFLSPVSAIDAYLVTGQSNGWRLSQLLERKGGDDAAGGRILGAIRYFPMKCVSEPETSEMVVIEHSSPSAKGHGLASALLERAEGEDIVFIQFCRCGASILGERETSWWPGFDGGLFGKLESYLESVEAHVDEPLEFKGIVWHQGEGDVANDPREHEAALREVFARLRKTVGNPEVPIVAGHIRDLGPAERAINAGIDRVTRDDFFAVSVSLAPDLAYEPDREGKPDVHIATTGCHQLGRDLAAALGRLGAVERQTVEVERDGLDAALKSLKPGTTLKLIPGDEPWPNGIRIETDGTAEAPIVIDGQGTIVSGRRVFAEAEWTAEPDGSYSRLLENNAWGMASYWEGGFPLVWFDGVAAANAETREALQPGGAFLYKNRAEAKTDPLHNRLFVKLPEGTAFDDVKVESIDGLGGIYVGGDHVTVRNFVCEYGGRDGFATHRNVGVVFENVEARFFMDQGISNHGGEVVVRDGWFHQNAGAGIVDVYPECRVRYERCRIENDTWRGGVEFHSGRFEMIDCEIAGNPKAALVVTKGAQVTIRDCRIEGSPVGIRFGGEGSSLQVTDSVVSATETGADVSLEREGTFAMSGTKLEDTERSIYVKVKGETPAMSQFELSDNALGGGSLEHWRAGKSTRFEDATSLVQAVTAVVE